MQLESEKLLLELKKIKKSMSNYFENTIRQEEEKVSLYF